MIGIKSGLLSRVVDIYMICDLRLKIGYAEADLSL
jgi:hypothetical protein